MSLDEITVRGLIFVQLYQGHAKIIVAAIEQNLDFHGKFLFFLFLFALIIMIRNNAAASIGEFECFLIISFNILDDASFEKETNLAQCFLELMADIRINLCNLLEVNKRVKPRKIA